MFRFILKFFSIHLLSLLLSTLWLPVLGIAQLSQSVAVLNEITLGTAQMDWLQWNSRVRSTTRTSIQGFDFYADISLSANMILHDETGVQAFKKSAFNERVSIKEISVRRSWETVDLQAGWLNIQWGLLSDGPTSQFLGRVDLSEFTMTDEEDLPLGQPALQSRFYLGQNYFDLLLTPYPYPSPLPDRNSRWDFITEPGQARIEWDPKRPPWGVDQLQFAARFAYKKALKWQAEFLFGRWAGSFPVFGFELTQTTPSLLFTLKERYTPGWITGASFEWLPNSSWIIRQDHLIHFNQKYLQLPFSRDLAVESLTNPQLAAILLPQLLNSQSDNLAEGIMSRHMISIERVLSGWTLTTGYSLTHYGNLNERSLRKSTRSTIGVSARKFALRDRLQLNLSSQWNLKPFDHWIHPSASWQSEDRWAVAVGLQLFGGNEPEPLFPDLSYYTYRESGFAYFRFTLFAF